MTWRNIIGELRRFVLSFGSHSQAKNITSRQNQKKLHRHPQSILLLCREISIFINIILCLLREYLLFNIILCTNKCTHTER